MAAHEIGGGVVISMTTDERDRFTGLEWSHECGASMSVPFDRPWNRQNPALSGARLYEVTSWEPLSLPESLVCPGCGIQGFIRGGKWLSVDSVAR